MNIIANRTVPLAALVATLAFAPCAVATAAGDRAPPPAEIRIEGNAVTIQAEGAPLGEILATLSEQGKFELIENTDTMAFAVTASIEKTPWREAIARLLERYHYALAMHPEKDEPVMLVVLSQTVVEDGAAGAGTTPGVEGPLSAAARAADARLERMMANPFTRSMREVEQARAELASVPDTDEELQRREDAAEQYADALRSLGSFTDPAAIEDPDAEAALVEGMRSSEPAARAAALESLRYRGAETASAISAARALATSDADPAVRRAALDFYVQAADPQAALGLVRDLSRSSNPVRDIAVREWIRLRNELASSAAADEQVRLSEEQNY